VLPIVRAVSEPFRDGAARRTSAKVQNEKEGRASRGLPDALGFRALEET
jgi:hypothetical protein